MPSSDPSLPEPTEELYFAGMEMHGNVIAVQALCTKLAALVLGKKASARFGKEAALLYLKYQRQAALLYAADEAGYSVRDTPGLQEPEKARRAARLRLALIDKLEQHIRDS